MKIISIDLFTINKQFAHPLSLLHLQQTSSSERFNAFLQATQLASDRNLASAQRVSLLDQELCSLDGNLCCITPPHPSQSFSGFEFFSTCKLCVASLQIPQGQQEALSPAPPFQGQGSTENLSVQAPCKFSMLEPLMKSGVSKWANLSPRQYSCR